MARSFYTGNYTQLYTGSASFSTQITAAPTAVGLTSQIATAYAALNATYAAAFLAAASLDTRTKGSVAARNDAAMVLRARAAELAKLINGTSTVTNQQKIDLGLSVRKLASPVPPPGTPTAIRATLGGDGSLTLAWKCNNPRGASGTMYQVYRRATAAGEFTYLGGAGEKKFVDATIPAGAAQVTYQIQAVRSTAVGPWAQFNVNFGAVAGGGETAAAVGEKSPKLAA